jgi:hypothetical protein
MGQIGGGSPRPVRATNTGAVPFDGGDIPVETLRAYALSFADGIRSGRITVLADDRRQGGTGGGANP